MFATLNLDYVHHLERGYCVNHPDVIAQTQEQVVDRAVKQLLEALQTNGFELDGNILKRGNGWLQYDTGTSKWQYSNDAGVTWADMGSGGITDHTLLSNIGTNTHAQIDTHLANAGVHVANPLTLGNRQIRENNGLYEAYYNDGVNPPEWVQFKIRRSRRVYFETNPVTLTKDQCHQGLITSYETGLQTINLPTLNTENDCGAEIFCWQYQPSPAQIRINSSEYFLLAGGAEFTGGVKNSTQAAGDYIHLCYMDLGYWMLLDCRGTWIQA